jgi:hypothetical protein
VTDIEVRSCTVRVVRRDGWSWGPDPRRLLNDVLAAAPQLIENALATAVPEGASGEVREPIQVRVPLRRADLRAFASDGPAMRAPSRDVQHVETTLARAFRQALISDGLVESRLDAPPADAAAPVMANPVEPQPPGPAVLRVLLGLYRAGRLFDLLDRVPEPVLHIWHEALVSGWRGPSVAAVDAAELAVALDEALPPAERHPVPLQLTGWLRARIAAMTAVAARTGAAGHPQVLAALAAKFGRPPRSEAETHPSMHSADASQQRVIPSAAAADAPNPISPEAGDTLSEPEDRPSAGEVVRATGGRSPSAPITGAGMSARHSNASRMSSALPFLVLVQLSRVGWIDVLTAGVEAGGLSGHWSSLAAALAFSVLDEPGDGWRRSPRDRITAAAFAGLEIPFVERAVPEDVALLAPPLDAVLGRTLADGHHPGDLLLLIPTGQSDELVLFDSTGMFPMAWGDNSDDLAGWLEACADSPVVTGLDAGPTAHVGSEDHELPDRACAVLAAMRARRALPLTPQPVLERSFTLAAWSALASIGWTMWGADEPTDPLLTLHRLASLDARVHDEESQLRVVLPLGARYFALHEYRLLGEVASVPWLGGRSVEIVGG